MPADPRHYMQHGGGHDVIIVRCPNVVGDRLVHFARNRLTGNWVLRDFVTRRQLTNLASTLTAEAIDADANYSEPAPLYDASHVDDWAGYLILKTMFLFHPRTATLRTPPNPASGAWSTL